MDAISRLGLDVETQGLERGARTADRLAQSMDRAEKEAGQLENRTRRVGAQMDALTGMARNLAAQLGAAFSVYALVRANDAWVSATNQLRLVTQSAMELRDVTQEVYDLSQRTASRFEATAGLYASIQRAAGAAIGSQREVLRLTETISKLASASGGPEGSRNAALFQLRQLLQGSVVQAQEFNSLIDGTPLLVQAIADSIGVTRAELRRMVLDGNLAVTTVIQALRDQADEADALFARVNFTIGDALIRIQNAFQRIVGTQLGPIFSQIVNAISVAAEHLNALIPVLSGVAVAVAVAFAPTAVVAFAGAVASLFTLIAAHPFAALAGGLVAAVSAMRELWGETAVAKRTFEEWIVTVEDGVKTYERRLQGVEVTLRDVVDGWLGELRDGVAKYFRELELVISHTEEQVKGAAGDTRGTWDDMWEGITFTAQAFGNFVISLVRTIVDTVAIVVPRIGDLFAVAFTDATNAAIGATETILNQLRRLSPSTLLTDTLGITAPVALPRITDNPDARARLAETKRLFDESVDRNFPGGQARDWIGDANRRAQEQATATAAARARAQAEQEAEAAAQAAAEANAQAAAALQKQIDARQALFDELAAQLTLNEREFAIYQETEQLLRQFPDYYRQAAAASADMADTARDIAEQDARQLDLLRRKVAVLASMKEMAQDAERQRQMLEAALVGADQLEVVERTFDLLEAHADYYESMGKSARDVAEADARRQLSNERTLDLLTQQAERARDIANAPIDNLRDGLMEIEDRFWSDFQTDGFGAIDNLSDYFSDVWRRLQTDIVRAIFDPVTTGLRNAITGAVQGALNGTGGGFSLGGLLGSIFGGGGTGGPASLGSIIGGGVSGGAAAGAGGVLGGLGNALGLGGILGGVNDWLSGGGILSAFGFGSGSLTNALSGGGILSTLQTGLGNFLVGNTIASALGLVGNSTGGMIGGGAGALLGNMILPGIGGIIGSFLGSALGGLFGPGVTSHMAAQRLTANGVSGRVWGVGGDDELIPETIQGVTDAAQRVLEGQDILRQLGGTLGSFVSYLAVSANRERSGYKLTDTVTGQQTTEIRSSTIGDPQELSSTALRAVLSDTTFANETLDAVSKAMLAAGKSFEDVLEVLGDLHDILPATEEATSQWGQALDKLEQTFADLRASTEGVAGVAEQLDQAFADAMAALGQEFAKSIEDSILAIESPLTLQFEQLLKVQAQRLTDANRLGVDVARVMHLNELELTRFIEQAGGSAEAFAALNDIFQELIDKAAAAGNATQPLIDAYNQARAGVVNAFDNDVAQQIANLANPTLGALKALLDAQKARLEQARAIGANIIAVERLNAMEQKAFFESLTDEQRQSLAAYLGMIEDFTGRIAVVLSQLNDELNARINDTDAMRQDLLRQADAMRTLSENLASTRQSIVDRYGALTPMAGVNALRERFANLAEEARGGNDSALQALAQVGQQLIEASRNLYGSTSTFRGDYDLVTSVLQEAESLATDRADTLESQAQTLLEQRDLLIEIRDILAQPDPMLEQLQQRLDLLDVNQEAVATLLTQYLQLTQQQGAQQIDLSALQDAANGQVQVPAITAPTTGATVTTTPTASNTTGAQAQAPGQNAAGTQGDSQTAQMVAVLIDVQQNASDTQNETLQGIKREMRKLNEKLGYSSSVGFA